MPPENEIIRRKRDLEFQSRVLAALDKPKENRFWTLLNRPFTIWLLSLIVLSVGGFYIAAYRQCQPDAYAQIAEFTKIRAELFERVEHAYDIIEYAKTVSAMQEALSVPHYNSVQFKEYPFKELAEQYLQYAELHIVIDLQGSAAIWPFKTIDYQMLFLVMAGTVVGVIDDKDIPELRKVFSESHISTWAMFASDPSHIRQAFEPVCSPGVVFQRAINGEPARVVRALY